MPGAPPVMLLSDGRDDHDAVLQEVDRGADRLELQLASRPPAARCYTAAELGPAAPGPLEQHQFRAAVIPVVEADVGVLPAVLGPHRRADPLPAGQLRRGDLNLGELIAGERISASTCHPVTAPGRPGHRIRGDRHPPVRDISPVRTQRPIRPAEIIRGTRPAVELVVQETATLVTSAEATVPEPPDTVQVWPDGLVFTVTS